MKLEVGLLIDNSAQLPVQHERTGGWRSKAQHQNQQHAAQKPEQSRCAHPAQDPANRGFALTHSWIVPFAIQFVAEIPDVALIAACCPTRVARNHEPSRQQVGRSAEGEIQMSNACRLALLVDAAIVTAQPR